MNEPIVYWVRQDLRLRDNPALRTAVSQGPVLPVFLLEDAATNEQASGTSARTWSTGAAARWWLHHSLIALDSELQSLGSRLTIRRGDPRDELLDVVETSGAKAVYWNRRYDPEALKRERDVKDALQAIGVETRSFSALLLKEPWQASTQSRGPFRVFTPFKRHVLATLDIQPPLLRPRAWSTPRKWPRSLRVEALELLPRVRWDQTMQATWQPGEAGARGRLRKFLRDSFANYAQQRDRPDLDATSKLSPHLHHGEISPRQILHALASAARSQRMSAQRWMESTFVAELLWREFSYHLLYHFPHTPLEPLDRRFNRFAWVEDGHLLRAWQRGRTGYPMVDAGMRELWATGWMHNRARMIAGSFLVKNLRIHWLDGARWFWDTLVDADLAANTLNWQWVAGCGADAAPYFRIFNPVAQGRQFDPDGAYIRTWIPELRCLPVRYIHEPHLAPAATLAEAGIELGVDYPRPIVDLKASREAALAAFRRMR